jgi:hypothetical protein
MIMMSLLDADADSTSWAESRELCCNIDPFDEPERARHACTKRAPNY